MNKHTKYTVVQHSGWGYTGKDEFERGLEVRAVALKLEQQRVVRAGGLLFDKYDDADAFCDLACYPDDSMSLLPRARGTFAKESVDGLPIYVPVREVTG